MSKKFVVVDIVANKIIFRTNRKIIAIDYIKAFKEDFRSGYCVQKELKKGVKYIVVYKTVYYIPT